MKSKLLVYILFLTINSYAQNNHTTLVIPSVSTQDPYWSYANTQIHQKESLVFAHLVEKIQNAIDSLWLNLLKKIYDQTQISLDDINYQLDNKKTALHYMSVYKNYFTAEIQYADNLCAHNSLQPHIYTTQPEIHPEVLNYFQLKHNFLQIEQPVMLIYKDDFEFIATSFGSDALGNYLICNTSLYSLENIQNLYACQSDETLYHFEPSFISIQRCRCIELSNLMHLGLTQSYSGITHQSDLFIKIFSMAPFDKKNIPVDLKKECSYFVQIRSHFEACLQSKNPLESANFISPSYNQETTSEQYCLLWKEFENDLKNCYDKQDLDAYETHAYQIKKTLFENYND